VYRLEVAVRARGIGSFFNRSSYGVRGTAREAVLYEVGATDGVPFEVIDSKLQEASQRAVPCVPRGRCWSVGLKSFFARCTEYCAREQHRNFVTGRDFPFKSF